MQVDLADGRRSVIVAAPMTETDAFKHSTPELYDRFMGPLLFEPYAALLAERSALLQPGRILETAAGTGIVTRALSESVPQAQIVATDINPAVIEFAAAKARLRSGHISACERTGPAVRRRKLRPRRLCVRRDVLPRQGPRK